MEKSGGPPPEVSAPPPAYSQQPVPGYPAGQAPPSGNYPQSGGNYPPPSGNYPPPSGNYPPPAGQQAYQGQSQPAASPQQVVVVQRGAGTCPSCGVGYRTEDYTCCGITLAILFFPLGIICCLLMKESKCSHCGKPM